MRRWANKKKSALYKHYVKKSTDRAAVLADEKYEEYSTKVFNAMDKAAENGQFCAYCFFQYPINHTALDELIGMLRDSGFIAKYGCDDWYAEELIVKWRK